MIKMYWPNSVSNSRHSRY